MASNSANLMYGRNGGQPIINYLGTTEEQRQNTNYTVFPGWIWDAKDLTERRLESPYIFSANVDSISIFLVAMYKIKQGRETAIGPVPFSQVKDTYV